DRPYLLFVGNRGTYKNFDLLARTYARSDRLQREFDIVCFGGQRESSHPARLEQLGIASRVQYFSGGDQVLANLYRHAFALVYPSKYEGFGIPPLEAMHYGCPVIASNAGSLPEVVADAGLMFDPNSEDDLLNKLYRLIDD